MTAYGWIVLGEMAMKTINGRDVIVMAKPDDIREAIAAREAVERQRMLSDLGNLARLVDGAMTRLQIQLNTRGGYAARRLQGPGDL
ncbi:hypothetical protein GCM10022252_41570 [Streptosporangium oxazolinicum]|uniref:Uncharacterized protein n=1 Tax=Streptosporangium oxazolinicum TaxID=909287 RepID=A0ABP8B1E2_9ACTN